MSASIAIDASRLESLLSRYANAGPVVDREGKAALDRAAIRVQNSARGNLHSSGAIDTGQLINNIGIESRGPFARAIGTNKTYGEVVEKGRDENKAWPPPGSLIPWMRRHGMDPKNEWFLRKKIGQLGIAARPYLVPALEENEPAIQREFDLAADRALAELAG